MPLTNEFGVLFKISNSSFFIMESPSSVYLPHVETACSSLLCELQTIWNEVGESEDSKDGMLLELEQECLEIYRRKVDQANRSRAQMRQVIADHEAKLAAICSALGERPVHLRQNVGSLKEELNLILPQLEEIRNRKSDRMNQFIQVIEQIRKTTTELGHSEHDQTNVDLDESDLSLRRLEDLHKKLWSLQKEKSDRLKLVMDHLNTLSSLCAVLGMDFKQTVCDVHPTLDITRGPGNVSKDLIEKLASEIQRIRALKIQRMQKLQDLATSMFEMWNLMDTPIEEQQKFQNITCNIAASEHEITEPNALSIEFLNYVESEVLKLEQLKASKMKELVLKKKIELDELCRKTHLVQEANLEEEIEAVEKGIVDPALVLEKIEIQISTFKEEAFSRKDILERVEKWLAACDEELWLEEYSRDENRYNAGRGTHLTLKRAEKARAISSKLPATVDTLVSKVTSWEKERGIEFTYDGVGLLSMLEGYTNRRQEKEQERKRQRDQKKLQGQLIAEQEVLFGSKPSPQKTQNSTKMLKSLSMGPKRRQSQAGLTPKSVSSARKSDSASSPYAGRRDQDGRERPVTPRKPFTPLATENSSSRPSTSDSTASYNDFEEEENMNTPNTTSIAPRTPNASSHAPMQMVATPAQKSEPAAAVEHSFEERRLAAFTSS